MESRKLEEEYHPNSFSITHSRRFTHLNQWNQNEIPRIHLSLLDTGRASNDVQIIYSKALGRHMRSKSCALYALSRNHLYDG